MNVYTVPVGPFQVNCYLVAGPSREALVIDPGAEPARIAAELERRRLSVAAYLLTHGHVDHVSGVAELHRRFPAPIAMHASDAAWAFQPANQMPPFYPAPEAPAARMETVSDGQSCRYAGLTYRVLETPGHTPGGLCFLFEAEAALFTGDTLFAGSVGRTDLPGGDAQVLADSLAKLAGLPAELTIYPGHGPITTLADEMVSNPFL